MINGQTIVIAAFPGAGKSVTVADNPDLAISDSDSSNYSWKIVDGVRTDERNPEFPQNYITRIKDMLDDGLDFVFVSTHKEVRKALEENKIKYVLVYPEKECKEEYMKRFEKREDTEEFIKTISDNWDAWIDDMSVEAFPKLKMLLGGDQYLDRNMLETIATMIEAGAD